MMMSSSPVAARVLAHGCCRGTVSIPTIESVVLVSVEVFFYSTATKARSLTTLVGSYWTVSSKWPGRHHTCIHPPPPPSITHRSCCCWLLLVVTAPTSTATATCAWALSVPPEVQVGGEASRARPRHDDDNHHHHHSFMGHRLLPICGWVGVQDSWEKVLSRKGTVYPAFQPPYRFKMLEVHAGHQSEPSVRPSGPWGGHSLPYG